MSGRRLDVTATQAVASMLATLTGAVAASGLGIAGTIIGAAFMSLASTVGAAVYKLYIARSNERLRTAAANLTPRASGNTLAAAVARRRQLAHDPDETAPSRHARQPGAANAGADKPGAAKPDAAAIPDLTETEVIPALAGLSHTRPLAHEDAAADAGGRAGGQRGSTQDRAPAARTEGLFSGDSATGGDAANEAAATADLRGRARPKARTWRPGARRRWLALAAVALGVFAAGMGTITAFEAIAGKPLDTVVWHRSGSGTTIGGLVGHSPSRHRGPQPGHSTSPTISPSSPASSRPTPTPTPTPTNSVSPTPTPTPPATSTPPANPGSSASSGTGTGTGTAPGLSTAPSSNSTR